MKPKGLPSASLPLIIENIAIHKPIFDTDVLTFFWRKFDPRFFPFQLVFYVTFHGYTLTVDACSKRLYYNFYHFLVEFEFHIYILCAFKFTVKLNSIKRQTITYKNTKVL